jgi:competence ComEA-like helix-hairpin-helix protein
MKKLIRSYGTFSRGERLGLYIVCGVLLIVICVRATLSLWIHPAAHIELSRIAALRDSSLQSADTTDEEAEDADPVATVPAAQQPIANKPALLELVDLNSADSAQLSKVEGISPAAAGRIVAYRERHGLFESVRDVLQAGGISPAQFAQAKKQLVIGAVR